MENRSRLRIKYTNVQNWTEEKETALIGHLTEKEPDIILITSTSKLHHQKHIKIQNYNTFATNKSNERHAGAAIAIKKGINFEIKNNFLNDCIGAQIQTTHGPVLIATAYSPPRHNVLPQHDLNHIMRNHIPTILAADLNARHRMFGYAGRTGNLKGNN